jgi:hypothetical protein
MRNSPRLFKETSMKKLSAGCLAGALVFLSACQPPARVVQVGPPGPQGPPGSGYAEMVIQPAPEESRGRGTMICSARGKQGRLPSLSLGVEKNGNVNRLLFYFDLTQAGLPAQATILSAILILYPNNMFCAAGRITAHVYPVTRAWTEEDATWMYADPKARWDNDGGDYLGALPMGGFWAEGMNLQTAPCVAVHLDPTTVQGWFNGFPNYGLIIKADAEAGWANMVTFYGREYSLNPSKRPQLKIIYK